MRQFCFVSLIFVVAAFGANLPNNYQKCRISDPKLNKCLTKNAIAAWPSIVQGDKRRHILVLDPLNVPFLHFPVHKNLKGNVTEALIYGLQDMKINEINMNLAENTIDVRFFIPRLTLFGNYDVIGQILEMFPIIGQGTVNFTIYDMDGHLRIAFDLIEKQNKQYIAVTDNSMEYNTTKLHFNCTNLFGGDKMLGDLTNKIMNENWNALNREIGSTVADVFGDTFTEISKGVFKKVPFEEIISN